MSAEVRFLPGEESVEVELGTTVLAAARLAGVPITASCGGRGTCGSCAVKTVDGVLGDPDDVEFKAMARLPKSVRLACRAVVIGPVTVEPLTKTLAVSKPAVLATVGPTSIHDIDDDDYEPPKDASPESSTQNPTHGSGRTSDLLPSTTGAGGSPRLAVGVDLGTTNVSATVIEIESGKTVGTATVRNRQASWGADVLSRLSLALGGDAEPLRNAAQLSVMDAVSDAMGERSDLKQSTIARVVVAANSVMSALLAGADASSLAAAPFLPVRDLSIDEGPMLRRLPDGTKVEVLQPIAAFVGGDTRAAIISAELGQLSAGGGQLENTADLLVDLGTNAEVVLRYAGKLWVASAPAGSAFEGIGEPGQGLTGSQLLAGVHAALVAGALDESGLLAESHETVSRDEHGVLQYLLGKRGTISQLDIRNLQLAKSAVRAAIDLVMDAAGVTPAEIATVQVAGAFGGAVPTEHLTGLGIVPPVGDAAIHAVGNAALQGALAIARGGSPELGLPVEHVNLVEAPAFTEHLMLHTAFRPH